MKKLSIIIPVYNEEKTLIKIVGRIEKVEIGGIKKEIIIIDDASTDNTPKIISKLKKKYGDIKFFTHKKNKGKGAAIKTGLQHISGDIIVIQDGDLEYNPEDFKKLIKPILNKEVKVVYGSRMINKKNRYSYISAYIGNIIINKFANFLYGSNLTDLETCYKMISSNAIKDIKLESKKFDIEPEITAKLIMNGYDILEIPIEYNPRSIEQGKKIKWKDGIIALYKLLKYRFKSK